MSQIFHGILISTDQTACATDFVVFESPFPFNLDLSLMGFCELGVPLAAFLLFLAA
jgi:hypothetical protein